MFPLQVLTTEFWENLIHPRAFGEEITAPLPPIVLLCLSVDHANNKIWPQIYSLIETLFPKWQRVSVFDTFIFIFSSPPQELKTQAQALIEEAPKLGVAFTISAEEAAGDFTSWRIAAQRAITAVRKKISHGAGQIYDFTELGPKHDPTMQLSPNEQKLLLAIKTGQIERARTLAQRSSEKLFTSHLYVLSHLRTRLRELAVLIAHGGVDAGIADQKAFATLNEFFQKLEQEHDYLKLEELYLDFITQITQQVLQANRKPSSIVGEAKQFLEKYFRLDLTLESVAEELSVSQSHLSRCFRQETGYTFTEFLNMLRLEEAARLLLDHTLSVTEICYLVGYRSLPHFQKVFRDFFDTSPSNYRKQKS